MQSNESLFRDVTRTIAAAQFLRGRDGNGITDPLGDKPRACEQQPDQPELDRLDSRSQLRFNRLHYLQERCRSRDVKQSQRLHHRLVSGDNV